MKNLFQDKRIAVIPLLLLALIAVASLNSSKSTNSAIAEPKIQIKDRIFALEMANTDEERTRGLSGRDSLPQNKALLFVFEKPGQYGFWMKDMKFPIDIFWLNENYNVVHIEKNVSPNTFPNIYSPSTTAIYVLETNAGIADNLQIKVGDKLERLVQ